MKAGPAKWKRVEEDLEASQPYSLVEFSLTDAGEWEWDFN